MEVWLSHKESGTEMGINDDGELFIGNKDSGGNAPDTLENRRMFIKDFCRYTGCQMPIISASGKPITGISVLKFKRGSENIKKVLDAACGSRMFWFDKTNPDVIFADKRELETTLCDGRTLLIKPDIKMDFTNMTYADNTFKVVVFDPPHLIKAGEKSWLAKKYGTLPSDWKPYLKKGFTECMRVLEPSGLLIFKWNEEQIKLSDILKEFGIKPLLGDQRGKTRWIVFMK